MKRIYFDYAATTPLDPAVRRAMMPYFEAQFGNPGSLHSFGQEALAAVDAAREKIGRALGLDILKGFREIIFTGSATEANNLALRAVLRNFSDETGRRSAPAADRGLRSRAVRPAVGRDQAERRSESFLWKNSARPKILVSAIEHESILETARDLERDGAELVILPVDKNGVVDLRSLKKNLTENTALVSVMFANNETGVIQPVSEISKIISDFRKQIANSKSPIVGNKPLAISHWPLFHVDAVQAFQYLDCSPDKLAVDLLTLSAHKIYGPKGVGALYIRSGIFEKPLPIITGGGQEFGWRSGTENVPLIVGFGQAAEMAISIREKEKTRIAGLRDYFWRELRKIYPKSEINGSQSSLPNILNVYFPGQSAEKLLIKFDLAGMAVSAGSACSARATKISHVLKAMDLSEKKIKSNLRFSFGRFTDKAEIKEVLTRIRKIF